MLEEHERQGTNTGVEHMRLMKMRANNKVKSRNIQYEVRKQLEADRAFKA